jgi:hypothetical protein
MTNSNNSTFKQYHIYFLVTNSQTGKYLIYKSPQYIPNVMTQTDQSNLEEVAWYHLSRLVGEKEAMTAAKGGNGRKGASKSTLKGVLKSALTNENKEDSTDTAHNIIQLRKVLRLKIEKSPVSSRYQPVAVLVTADIGNTDLVARRSDTDWVSGGELLEIAQGLRGKEKELVIDCLEIE